MTYDLTSSDLADAATPADQSERFVFIRQIRSDRGGIFHNLFNNNWQYEDHCVPGRVLDRIRNELLLHYPDLEQRHNLDDVVLSIVRRLARPEAFDANEADKANRRWRVGRWRKEVNG